MAVEIHALNKSGKERLCGVGGCERALVGEVECGPQPLCRFRWSEMLHIQSTHPFEQGYERLESTIFFWHDDGCIDRAPRRVSALETLHFQRVQCCLPRKLSLKNGQDLLTNIDRDVLLSFSRRRTFLVKYQRLVGLVQCQNAYPNEALRLLLGGQ